MDVNLSSDEFDYTADAQEGICTSVSSETVVSRVSSSLRIYICIDQKAKHLTIKNSSTP